MNQNVTHHQTELTPDNRLATLSLRQHEVLTLARQNLTNEQIAQNMGVSVLTVKKHRRNILKALGLCGKRGFRQAIHLLERHQNT